MVLREEKEIDHTTEQQVEGEWLKRSLDDLIDQMPPGRKNIYKLSRQQEMSTKEIAEKLGISVSTVETQLSLATKYMKNELLKHRDKLIFIALLFTLFFSKIYVNSS